MNITEINRQLENLYSSQWETLETELSRNCISNDYASPLLIKLSISKNYSNELKIMLFGQETRGWHGRNESIGEVDKLMDAYADYFFDRDMRHYENNKLVATGAFRKGYVSLRKKLAKEKLAPIFIWNNLRKIGRDLDKVGVSEKVHSLEQKYFDVIQNELNIIKPDFLIFCTGPSLDNLLLNKLNKIRLEQAIPNIPKREFAKIVDENDQVIGIRTYHPRAFYKALNNGGLEFLLECLNSLK